MSAFISFSEQGMEEELAPPEGAALAVPGVPVVALFRALADALVTAALMELAAISLASALIFQKLVDLSPFPPRLPKVKATRSVRREELALLLAAAMHFKYSAA